MLLGTSHMKSSKIQQDLNVIHDNKGLDRVSHTNFLGVLIDENFTWKYHIDCVSKTSPAGFPKREIYHFRKYFP